jgi:hypothetical protein
MKKNLLVSAAIFAGATLFITSCSKSSDAPASATVEKTQTLTVNFSSDSAYTYFSFKDTAVVASADSATTHWDFGLRLTTFIVNSHAGGPGNAGVIMMDTLFSNVAAAPATGYAYDTSAAKRAITDGSWYSYNVTTHTFSPTAGKVFIFRTADGSHYAKMELLSATYAPFTGYVPVKIIYRLHYTYQANGTVNF